MSTARVRPAEVRGAVQAPPSKSYTHRFVLAAHLSGRASRVRLPLVSADTLRTARAVRTLGSSVDFARGEWTISPDAAGPSRRVRTIDCGESGTTLRLMAASAALRAERYRFVGSGRLPHRPMAPLLDALRGLGATVVADRASAGLPFELRGPIHGGDVALAVDESSQFTSALLFALPTVRPGSTIRAVGTPVSEPYVRASVAVIRGLGVRLRASGTGFLIPGGQRYDAVDATVPGDASSAAYLWAAAALTGGTVTVRGVPLSWPQADLAVLDLLSRFGAEVDRRRAGITVRGGGRRPFRVRLTATPDLYPLAGVLAAAAPGTSYLVGAEHVAAKESDRRAETARLVRAMGARARDLPGALAVEGVRRPRPLRLRQAHDHRIVMSAAVGALAASGSSEVGDAGAVGKSFPEFFTTLGGLGVEVGLR